MAKTYRISSDGTLCFLNGPSYIDDDEKKDIPETFTKIKFAKSFESLYNNDFEYCRKALAKVTVLDFQNAKEIVGIDDDTFTGAESLRAVSLPKKMTYINEFKDCPKLKEIHIYKLKRTYMITGDADKRLSVFASNVSDELHRFVHSFIEDVGVLYVPSWCIERLQEALDDSDDELDIRPLPEDYEFPDVVEYPLYADDDTEEQSEGIDEEQNETSSVDIMSQIFAGTLYYCVLDGQSFGPVTVRQFANMARYGIVNANTMVWTQGMAQWAIAQSIAELQTIV